MSINLPERLKEKDLPRVSVTLHTQIMQQAVRLLQELKWEREIKTLESDFPCVRLLIPILDNVYMIVFSKNGAAYDTQVEMHRLHPSASLVISIKNVNMIRQVAYLFKVTTQKHQLFLQAFTKSKDVPTELPDNVTQQVQWVPNGLKVTLYARHRQPLTSILTPTP